MALPYQFGLSNISGFQDHSNVPPSPAKQNQLLNIYLIVMPTTVNCKLIQLAHSVSLFFRGAILLESEGRY